MRKRFITPTSESIRTRDEDWLDVERAAVVEVTSEDDDWPVEFAFGSSDARGWRAAVPGSQTIRLVFDQPQKGPRGNNSAFRSEPQSPIPGTTDRIR